MNRTQLPMPPHPTTFPSVGAWQLAVYGWMTQVKSRIEADSTANVAPIAPFVVGTYTETHTIAGTDATSNFVATLVAGMQAKGITAPTSQRTGS